jgi:hypothetical protein
MKQNELKKYGGENILESHLSKAEVNAGINTVTNLE